MRKIKIGILTGIILISTLFLFIQPIRAQNILIYEDSDSNPFLLDEYACYIEEINIPITLKIGDYIQMTVVVAPITMLPYQMNPFILLIDSNDNETVLDNEYTSMSHSNHEYTIIKTDSYSLEIYICDASYGEQYSFSWYLSIYRDILEPDPIPDSVIPSFNPLLIMGIIIILSGIIIFKLKISRKIF